MGHFILAIAAQPVVGYASFLYRFVVCKQYCSVYFFHSSKLTWIEDIRHARREKEKNCAQLPAKSICVNSGVGETAGLSQKYRGASDKKVQGNSNNCSQGAS